MDSHFVIYNVEKGVNEIYNQKVRRSDPKPVYPVSSDVPSRCGGLE